MDFVNSICSSAFSALMGAIGWMGWFGALVFVSAVFGIIALLIFKQISFQGGIKSVKDKIKGAMIEIRLYQNDLRIVAKAVLRVLGRNFQYLGLNFGPILPLLVPFAFLAAQLITWFAFMPIPVWTDARGEWMPGKGHEVVIVLDDEAKGDIRDVRVVLPDTLQRMTPIVRNERKGLIAFEVVAVAEGDEVITITSPSGEVVTKRIVTGEEHMGPLEGVRGRGLKDLFENPAEGSLADTFVSRIAFVYPARSIQYMADGIFGIGLLFLIFSMLAGVAILKPLKIQI
ncbi:hypothetical protein Pla163_32340 [Planctomycetes bacterium Pla163]|jgi:hypothetical protein|uniref:Uncharacterized protein n=1 Tax=Rohdeia mirabilis TaxID=2528008 RepID=A0A518D3P3_9BACT|nr:hypothetical protein Pla163_32340 [Planctomycetes bacterium Pla163]